MVRDEFVADLEHLQTMMENPEPLDPELQDCLDREVEGMLKHHLVTMPYFSTVHASIANEQLRAKKEMLAKADAERDWSQAIMLHERHARLLAFVERAINMEPKDYWHLLGSVWIDAEFPSTDRSLWLELFKAPRNEREHLMSEEERTALAAMPQELVIYRGTNGSYASLQGMSWTLSRKTAEWFMRRYSRQYRDGLVAECETCGWLQAHPEPPTAGLNETMMDRHQRRTHLNVPLIGMGKCAKSKVLAYFTERGEDEIVIDPKDIRDIRETRL